MEQHVEIGELRAGFSQAVIADALLRDIPDDVSEFLSEHSLASHFRAFVDLAAACFSNLVDMSAALQGNPEEAGAEWIDVEVRVRGEVEKSFAEYERFVEQLLDTIASDARSFLRLSLDVV